MKYWYYYSSEEFSSYIIRTPDHWAPDQDDPELSGHYHGPFDTARAARKEARRKIRGDIAEFREMLAEVNGPLRRRGGPQ